MFVQQGPLQMPCVRSAESTAGAVCSFSRVHCRCCVFVQQSPLQVLCVRSAGATIYNKRGPERSCICYVPLVECMYLALIMACLAVASENCIL